jgi:hypothetical protein
MEFPHYLPRSEVKDLLQVIISKREERNKHKKNKTQEEYKKEYGENYNEEDIETYRETDIEEYRAKDAELDALLEQLAQQFMSAPTRGAERFSEQFPPEEDEGEYRPPSEISNFNAAAELRSAIPSSANETPADLDTTPREKTETAEEKRKREYLESIYGGKKISAYSMKKTSLYKSLKKAPSTLYRSISSVNRKVNPFMKSKKAKKSKKTRKYKRS